MLLRSVTSVTLRETARLPAARLACPALARAMLRHDTEGSAISA